MRYLWSILAAIVAVVVVVVLFRLVWGLGGFILNLVSGFIGLILIALVVWFVYNKLKK